MMNRLSTTALYLTSIIPLALAMALGALILLHIPILHDQEFYLLPTISRKYIPFAIIYIVFVIAMWQLVYRLANKFVSLAVTIVFLSAFIPRMTLLWLFRNQILPFSDFLWSWDVAQGVREGHMDIPVR